MCLPGLAWRFRCRRRRWFRQTSAPREPAFRFSTILPAPLSSSAGPERCGRDPTPHAPVTGRHCLPHDPNGKLNIPRDAGFWLRDEHGRLTRRIRHICWDGCMFPNEVMMKADTWNDILGVMAAVRDAHGWREED